MISPDLQAVKKRAKSLYESRLRDDLERTSLGKFLCIEPESGQYFLGETFDDAVDAALDAFPDRLTFTLRVGYPAALHLGVVAL
jgi:hypothetical protein